MSQQKDTTFWQNLPYRFWKLGAVVFGFEALGFDAAEKNFTFRYTEVKGGELSQSTTVGAFIPKGSVPISLKEFNAACEPTDIYKRANQPVRPRQIRVIKRARR